MISATLRVFIVDPADHGNPAFREEQDRAIQLHAWRKRIRRANSKSGPFQRRCALNDGIGRGDVCLTLLVNMEYTDINGKEASIGISYYWDAPR